MNTAHKMGLIHGVCCQGSTTITRNTSQANLLDSAIMTRGEDDILERGDHVQTKLIGTCVNNAPGTTGRVALNTLVSVFKEIIIHYDTVSSVSTYYETWDDEDNYYCIAGVRGTDIYGNSFVFAVQARSNKFNPESRDWRTGGALDDWYYRPDSRPILLATEWGGANQWRSSQYWQLGTTLDGTLRGSTVDYYTRAGDEPKAVIVALGRATQGFAKYVPFGPGWAHASYDIWSSTHSEITCPGGKCTPPERKVGYNSSAWAAFTNVSNLTDEQLTTMGLTLDWVNFTATSDGAIYRPLETFIGGPYAAPNFKIHMWTDTEDPSKVIYLLSYYGRFWIVHPGTLREGS